MSSPPLCAPTNLVQYYCTFSKRLFCISAERHTFFSSPQQHLPSLALHRKDTLSPIFFTEVQFSWTNVRTLDLNSASLQDKLAGLVLIAELVGHILIRRKQSRAASWAQLSATIKCCAEATTKNFPETGSSLTTWSKRLRARCATQPSQDTSPTGGRVEENSPGCHPGPHFNLSA